MISPVDLSRVHQVRNDLHSGGYKPLRVETAGKKPLAKNWTAGETLQALLETREREANTGLLLSGLRAIDVDVDDPHISRLVSGLVDTELPAGGLRRYRENSERFAILFRTQFANAPKRRVGGTQGFVEVLGASQQLVVDGHHPSGVAIQWKDGRSPMTVSLEQLPEITEDQIAHFLKLCQQVLDEPKSPTPQLPRIIDANDELGAGLESGYWFDRLSPQLMEKVVNQCLNAMDNKTVDPRDRWLKILFAVHHAEELGCNNARFLANAWSARGVGWTDQGDFDTAWDSYKPGLTTVGTLLHMATTVGADLSQWIPGNIPVPPTSTSGQRNSLKAISANCLPAVPTRRRWLHGNDIMRGAVTLLVAPGARGKSTWLLHCALSCATGRPLLGSHVFGGPLKVLYCNAEDSINEINRRMQAAKIHHKIADAELATLKLAGAEQGNLQLLVSEKGIASLNEQGWQAIANELDESRPDILILDPLVAVLGGASINDNSAAALMMTELVRLAAKRDMGIVIAHHSSKGKDITSQDAAMGAATLINLARIALAVDTLKETDALKLGITPDKAKHFFRVLGTKQNLTKPSDQDRWYELCSVRLANAEPPIYPEGDEVAVVQSYTPIPGARAVPQALLDAVFQAVRSAVPPLSPTRRSHGSAAAKQIASVIAAQNGTFATENEAQSLIDHLLSIGTLRTVMKKIHRQGRGGYERMCLEVVEPVTSPDNAKQKLGDDVAVDGLGRRQTPPSNRGL